MHQHDMRWPMFNRVLQQAQRMEDMMKRLGVDPGLAARQEQGRAFPRARTICLLCPSAGRCERWLAQAKGNPEPPDFCPITPFFASCHRRHTSLAHTEGPIDRDQSRLPAYGCIDAPG
jgi:transcriptional regulator with XRE-family HTH domain